MYNWLYTMNISRYLFWMNREIPAWLDKFKSFSDFDAATVGAAASGEWKVMAYAMAKERWNVSHVKHIPR